MNPPAPVEDLARPQLRQACADLERRLRAGEDCRAEDILAAFPALAAHADSALELIYTEFVVREQLGQKPSPADWYARFPQWRDDLEQLFQVHDAVTDRDGGVSTIDYSPSRSDSPSSSFPDGRKAAVGRPRRVGRYLLLEEIGRGGMGVVYKARQPGLNRIVALKMILSGEHAGAEQQARFRREAEAVAGLQHPNIVQIHEVGEWQAGEGAVTPFLSLEYVDGGSLQQKLAQSLPAPHAAARLLEVLARAVQYAHERGVLHRDLKPANVLLTADGTPKITDFGLAKQVERKEDGDPPVLRGLTRTGVVLGTPGYMAPEQVGGVVGPAADVFALGAILYECLAGRPPFRAESPLETMLLTTTRDPAPPSALQPKTPRDLETICLKCLRKEPGRRYASARDLAEDLERFLAGKPIQARPTPLWERGLKWARRRPAVAGLLVAVVAVAALGAGAFTWSYGQTLDALGQARHGRDHERKLKEEAEAALADKTVALARLEWLNDDPEKAGRLLDECPPAYRGRDWRYLDRVCRGCLLTQSVGSGEQHGPAVAWSPDGAYLASAANADAKIARTEVKLWDAGTGRKVRTFSGGGDLHVGDLAFTADGRLVLAGHAYFASTTSQTPTAVKVWDRASGEKLQQHNWNPTFPQTRLGDDGRSFALASVNGLSAWDVVNGRELWNAAAPRPGLVLAVAVHEGGRLLAAGGERGVDVLDATTGQAAAPGIASKGTVRGLVFSPNGRRLAGATQARTSDGRSAWSVTLWDVETGRESLAWPVPNDYAISHMAFSPDGDRLAAAAGRTAMVWDAATGQELLTFRGPTAFDAVAFRPDGTRLASIGHDGVLRVWDVRPLVEP